MRVPYAVGRWVRGRAHYDRDQLVEHLLHAPHAAHWLIGTRRMGKTSLLRQIELIADHPTEKYVPLFWDLQGSETPADLVLELIDSLDSARERFARLGIEIDFPAGHDADLILRTLAQQVADHGLRLLLLVDEAEVLVHVAATHPDSVKRLYDVLADSPVRTVMASTKWLAHIDDVSRDDKGGVLLRDFRAVFLSRLDETAARALVHQEQGERLVLADDGTVDDVIVHTNGQPYLLQFLCQRLFVVDEEGRGCLRPLLDEDLEPDQLLVALFANDFQYLTQTEQRLILSVAKRRVAKQREIIADLGDVSPETVALYLYGLDRLGFLRRVFGQWAIGNEYLQRWLSAELNLPTSAIASGGGDATQKLVTELARQSEIDYCHEQLKDAETELKGIETDVLSLIGEETRVALARSAALRRRIAKLKRDLGEITHISPQ